MGFTASYARTAPSEGPDRPRGLGFDGLGNTDAGRDSAQRREFVATWYTPFLQAVVASSFQRRESGCPAFFERTLGGDGVQPLLRGRALSILLNVVDADEPVRGLHAVVAAEALATACAGPDGVDTARARGGPLGARSGMEEMATAAVYRHDAGVALRSRRDHVLKNLACALVEARRDEPPFAAPAARTS
jgi:hypothetical protein